MSQFTVWQDVEKSKFFIRKLQSRKVGTGRVAHGFWAVMQSEMTSGGYPVRSERDMVERWAQLRHQYAQYKKRTTEQQQNWPYWKTMSQLEKAGGSDSQRIAGGGARWTKEKLTTFHRMLVEQSATTGSKFGEADWTAVLNKMQAADLEVSGVAELKRALYWQRRSKASKNAST